MTVATTTRTYNCSDELYSYIRRRSKLLAWRSLNSYPSPEAAVHSLHYTACSYEQGWLGSVTYMRAARLIERLVRRFGWTEVAA